MTADPSVQFALTPAPPPPETPGWIEALGRFFEAVLRPIGRFLSWLFSWLPDAAYARILLGTLLVAGLLLLLWIFWVRVKDGAWKLPWRRREQLSTTPAPELAWLPEEAPALAWLEEADALAGQGRFAEAVHCLLLRSVEDLARRRPEAVRPAMTSRELAASHSLPDRARSLFAGLARAVEISLFGGRPVDENGWRQARDAYSQFAFAGTWQT